MSHDLELRVAATICQGTGWIRPVVLRADWPLGKLSVTHQGVQLSTLFIRHEYTIHWPEVTQITWGWINVDIEYQQSGTPYVLTLFGLFLQSQLKSYLQENQISIPVQ